MADALASTSTSAPLTEPEQVITLVQRALSANQALQHELTKRAEELEAKIKEADKLLGALESGVSSEDAEDEIQIPGARKASSLFPLGECLNPDSPFHGESMKRGDYAARITQQSFNPKQLESLKNAVKSENQRLQAHRNQTGDHSVHDLERNVEGVDWGIVAEKVSNTSSDKFTADQCRIKWVGDRHPSFNHSEWKPPEVDNVLKLVKDAKETSYGPIDWAEVATQLGTHRTVLDTMNHGQARERHFWDAQYDQRLLQAVEKYGLNNWMMVAQEVSENVTPTQCQNRYKKSLDPTIKRGAWTAVEDERLRKAVEAFGSSWVRVAEYVPGRTNDQCNERWTGQLNANTSKNVWSDEEDKMLLDLTNSMGRQWKAISEKIGNGKTGQTCRLRFNKLTSVKDNALASSSGQPLQSPVPGTASPSPSHITERQASAQSEHSTTPEAQGTTIANDEGDATKCKGKKRRRQSSAEPDKSKSTLKKRKTNTSGAIPDTSQGDVSTSTIAPPSKKPAPRPRARKPKGANTSQPESTSEESSGVSFQGTIKESQPNLGKPLQIEPSAASRRRSARVMAKSRDDTNP